ncbi:MAG TPA: terminase family protein [Allosphingosinicella sp.]|nr:terminase family protein [Allosphingosinicella sp.]
MKRSEQLAVLRLLMSLPPEMRRRVLKGFPREVILALYEEWWWGAFGGQLEPPPCADGSAWRVWTIMAGRGFGKTRAGAEWVWARARESGEMRIALVGTSLEEVARVMVEGESGLLAIAREGEEARWFPSKRMLEFPSGARAFAYSAERPVKLRGPQHHFAWCDELAHWPNADETFDNLMLGLRLGTAPRTIVTTTPKPVPLMKRVLDLPRSAKTEGRTDENPNNPPDYRSAMRDMYAGTRLARQELDGELLEDFPGALWTREMLDAARVTGDSHFSLGGRRSDSSVRESDCPLLGGGNGDSHFSLGGDRTGAAARESDCPFSRIVIGVDPPASAEGDCCGIVVCGLGEDGCGYVIADLTVAGLRPEGWARRVAAAAGQFGAARIVAEKNQGGDMVESVLRAADSGLPVKLVSATASKAARAEPVAFRFETGKAKLAGRFPELEDQLCAMTYAGYEGPGSPDRADAMVWAMTELFRPERPMPRITRL